MDNPKKSANILSFLFLIIVAVFLFILVFVRIYTLFIGRMFGFEALSEELFSFFMLTSSICGVFFATGLYAEKRIITEKFAKTASFIHLIICGIYATYEIVSTLFLTEENSLISPVFWIVTPFASFFVMRKSLLSALKQQREKQEAEEIPCDTEEDDENCE